MRAKFGRSLRMATVAAGVALFSASAAMAEETPSADDLTALDAPVKALADAINHAAMDPPAHIFTSDSSVIDDFAPYHWSGEAGQNADAWYHALVGVTPEDHKAFVAMSAHVLAGHPVFARITGDAAYLVIPALYDFDEDGKHAHQTGEWLFTEKKVDGTWLISASSYAITSDVRTDKAAGK